jgi:hypothetical protein
VWWLGKVCSDGDLCEKEVRAVSGLQMQRLTIACCSANHKHGILLASQPRYPLFQGDRRLVLPVDIVSSAGLHSSQQLRICRYRNGIT